MAKFFSDFLSYWIAAQNDGDGVLHAAGKAEDINGGSDLRESEGAAGGHHDADDEGRVQWDQGDQPRGRRLRRFLWPDKQISDQMTG